MAVTGTRNGYGQAFHSKEIQDKIVTMKEAQAAVMTAEQARIYWEKLVDQVEKMRITPTVEQARILDIGVQYYKSVGKTQDTLGMFSINNFSTKFLPPKVEDGLDSLTWILKVGKNDSKMDELFPNLRNKKLQPIKKVKEYSENPDDNEEHADQEIGNNKLLREFKGKGSMVDPLVVLYYCFYCHKCGDELQRVKRNTLNHNKCHIETRNYKIDLDITANSHREYTKIVVERR